MSKPGGSEFTRADLADPRVAAEAVRGMDIVFHLAADHGGRGYLDLHQVACATNLASTASSSPRAAAQASPR